MAMPGPLSVAKPAGSRRRPLRRLRPGGAVTSYRLSAAQQAIHKSLRLASPGPTVQVDSDRHSHSCRRYVRRPADTAPGGGGSESGGPAGATARSQKLSPVAAAAVTVRASGPGRPGTRTVSESGGTAGCACDRHSD